MELNKYLEQLKQLTIEHQAYEEHLTGRKATLSEETLSYLTDASELGRVALVDKAAFEDEVYDKHQLGQQLAHNIWWLSLIATEKGIDLEVELDKYLSAALDPFQKEAS